LIWLWFALTGFIGETSFYHRKRIYIAVPDGSALTLVLWKTQSTVVKVVDRRNELYCARDT
jgi:hypothetical protein